MAGKQNEWRSCKLKYLEANYERCKLKVRQDSLYCKLFILEYQNRLEEEKRITLKYEKNAICQRLQQAEQKHSELTNERDLTAKKAVDNLTNVEGEWKEKTDELMRRIESLQEENKNVIRSKDNYILELTNELHGLRRLLQSKEASVGKNGGEQPGRNGELHERTTTNTMAAQHPDLVEHQETNTIFERRNGKNSEESNVVADESAGEKLLESEVGCVLEVTEEMLKSCRRRSILKRKKSEVCYPVTENNGSRDVDLNERTKVDGSRRERRVTFNGELEFKLPNGSKEVAELEIDGEQLEDDDDDQDVFDDILSREAVGKELDYACNDVRVMGVGEDLEEPVPVKTRHLEEVEGYEAKNDIGDCGSDEIQQDIHNDENLAKESRRMGLRKKPEKENVVEEIDDNSGDKKKQSKEDRRFSVEADVLLSPDRQSGVQLNSDTGDCGEIESRPKKGTAKDFVDAQLGETGTRKTNHGAKRGLRSSGSKEIKPAKRLLDVFGNEVEQNQDEEARDGGRKGKAKRNTKAKKQKSNAVTRKKNIKNVEKEERLRSRDEMPNESVKGKAALKSKIENHNEAEPGEKLTRSKKAPIKKGKGAARKRRGRGAKKMGQSLVVENEECKHEGTQEHATEDAKEEDRLPQLSPSIPTVEVNAKDEQNMIDKRCEDKEQKTVNEHDGINQSKEEHEAFVTKKYAGKRRRKSAQMKINDRDVSDEMKRESEAPPRSKKRKSSEPEADEESNGGKENKRENNDSTKRKKGKKEQNTNENEEEKTILDNVAEKEQLGTNLRSKRKRKSSKRGKENNGKQDVKEKKKNGKQDAEEKKKNGKQDAEEKAENNAKEKAENNSKHDAEENKKNGKQDAEEKKKNGKQDAEKKKNNGKQDAKDEKKNGKQDAEEKAENNGKQDAESEGKSEETNASEMKQAKTNLRAKKRMSPETEMDENHKRNNDAQNENSKVDKQEKPMKKKRRTLYSIRENTTLFNATNSIFQETLPVNQTRSSTGMPPTLSTFMKAFVIPKLKKK